MREIIHRIRVLFKIARLASSTNETDFIRGVFEYLGTKAKGQVFIPYGTIGRPPDGSQMAVWAQNGNESNLIGLASDPKNRIKPDALPGEHGIGNYTTGHHIFFDNDGVANLVADEFVITTGDVVFKMNASGIAITGGAITHNGTAIDDTHTHGQDPDSGGDTEVETDPPS